MKNKMRIKYMQCHSFPCGGAVRLVHFVPQKDFRHVLKTRKILSGSAVAQKTSSLNLSVPRSGV